MQWTFGDILWTTVAIFVWAALIWMFIAVFGDIFRRSDLSGGAKAGWVFLIVILPFVGCLIYLITRPQLPEGQSIPRTGERTDFTYTRLDAAAEIEKAAKLQASGAITPEEFASIQEQALARAAGG